ncbi:MAG TPA: NAD(P)H-dependent oxidoreductase [bacterium]|nr:NAD(P)H-dependent oxidoreductase [bacterium]
MLKLQIIVGSTRQGRHADAVLRWVVPVAQAYGAFDVETLDLRDWPLPFFQEVVANMGDLADPTYSDPSVKRWNDKIKEGDAYLILTPEYNHSVPAVLKNAIDSVFFSHRFRHKPVAVVGYSIGGTAGVRAVEHLFQIMLETDAVPIRTPTLIPMVEQAFTAEGRPANPVLQASLGVQLDDLAWMAKALMAARQAGEPLPAAVRIRAALGRA